MTGGAATRRGALATAAMAAAIVVASLAPLLGGWHASTHHAHQAHQAHQAAHCGHAEAPSGPDRPAEPAPAEHHPEHDCDLCLQLTTALRHAGLTAPPAPAPAAGQAERACAVGVGCRTAPAVLRDASPRAPPAQSSPTA